MKRLTILLALLANTFLFAQSNDEQISSLLNQVARGQTNQVKSQIPDLVAAHPNDPGVKLILAVVIDDAFKAIEIYNEIVKDHPTSTWADDAYWRIIQFYAILGDTSQARVELNTFRQKYPTSEYIIPASDVVRSSVGLAKIDKKRVLELGDVFKKAHSHKATHKKKENLKTIVAMEKPDDGLANKAKQPDMQVLAKETNKPNIEPTVLENNQEMSTKLVDHSKENNTKKTDNKKTEDKKEDMIKPLEQEPIKTDKISDMANEKDKPLSAQEILDKKMAQNKKDIEAFKQRKKEEYDQRKLDELNQKIEEEESKVFYGLQVGLFNTKDAAEVEMKKFLQQRMRTEVRTKMIGEEQKYAVVIGNYSSRASAESAKYYVNQQCNCNPIILEK